MKPLFLLILSIAVVSTQPILAAEQTATLTDSRDGKKYKTVKIGKQTWMAENLNYNASGSVCYDNKPAYCEKYGRLYNWETATKVCPSGWHLPSISEWNELNKAVGGFEVAGKKLKSKSGWDYKGKSDNGTDEFGFSVLPGGLGLSDGSFGNVGDSGYWWSVSEDETNSNDAYRLIMDYDNEGAYYSNGDKSQLRSVRCLQD